MVESIARAAGLRTGLYTSPHLCRFAERIRVDGAPIDDERLRPLRSPPSLDRCRPDLTFFESLTVAAFVAFRDARVDVAVLEVGLGGRLDATNVIRAPVATAITSISLEHTGILGDTLDAIAREKAGILKPGAPVVLGPLPAEALDAIVEVAARVGAEPLIRVGHARRAARGPRGACEIRWRTTARGPRSAGRGGASGGARPPGAHQAENAGVAVGLSIGLAERFPEARRGGARARRGSRRATWPGRCERIAQGGVTVLLDAAHNPEGAGALAPRRSPPIRRSTALVFGALADKRWAEMLRARRAARGAAVLHRAEGEGARARSRR